MIEGSQIGDTFKCMMFHQYHFPLCKFREHSEHPQYHLSKLHSIFILLAINKFALSTQIRGKGSLSQVSHEKTSLAFHEILVV